MTTITYDMTTINENERIFFIEMIPYLSEHIIDNLANDGNLEIRISDDRHTDEVFASLDKLRQMVNEKKLGKETDTMETAILKDYRDVEPQNREPVFDRMIAENQIQEVAPGVFTYQDLFLSIFTYFKNKVKDFAREFFPTNKEMAIPVLFPIDKFRRGGYFETFPHHIMFKSALRNDLDVINNFSQKKITDDNLIDNMKNPDCIIRNAACVPIYPSIADSSFADDALPLTFYISDHCFRNEASNITELARLNEFNMSEIVFVGTPEQTREGIEKSKALWDFWRETFKLNCVIETANDSFFAGNYKKLKFFQLMGKSKIEFKWLLPHNGSYISCSSANYHLTHFTKRYNIQGSGGYLHSACFAFGIERLAYAFLCQHGLNPQDWDEPVRKEIGRFDGMD